MLEVGEVRSFTPPKVLASAANGVIDMIRRKGGNAEAIFASAAIRMSDVGCPTNELNLHQYCNLFEQAARQTGNDNFGLEFGAQFQPRGLGPRLVMPQPRRRLAQRYETSKHIFPPIRANRPSVSFPKAILSG